MPVLSNSRHELFAQHVADGRNLKTAFTDAGFKPSKAGPTRLKQKAEVRDRINEILDKRAGKTIEKYAVEVEYTREKLLGYLEEARLFALDCKNPSAAVSATVGMARVLGLIIDRREVGDAGAFDALTDEELVAKAAQQARELGVAGPVAVETEEPEPVDQGVKSVP